MLDVEATGDAAIGKDILSGMHPPELIGLSFQPSLQRLWTLGFTLLGDCLSSLCTGCALQSPWYHVQGRLRHRSVGGRTRNLQVSTDATCPQDRLFWCLLDNTMLVARQLFYRILPSSLWNYVQIPSD